MQVPIREARDRVDVLARTVLVVDDDPDMRLYLRSCLRSLTTPFDRVVEAADGVEALHVVRSDAIDLVICDIGLPGIDGRRLCRAIRDDVALRHVAVLLISGESALGDGSADGFLAKPFNSQQLRAALDEMPPRAASPPPLQN